MVAKCNRAGKPVIVATQMLDTMQSNPRPTRAEVSDVTNAVCDGADAVMLSGESANGKFPVESIETMRAIINATESSDLDIHAPINWMQGMITKACPFEAVARGAVEATRQDQASLIICITKGGSTPRLVAKYRPDVPVLCVCLSAKVGRQLQLTRGCHPVLMGDVSAEDHIAKAVWFAQELGFASSGDDVVIVGSESGQQFDMTALPTTPTVRIARLV
jgi:pyruvate kinase